MHYTFRLITQIRGGLVAVIFAKAVYLDAALAKDSAAVTLMSTDIDGIASGVTKIHDIWASVIELGLGLYLLQRQVGAACVLFLVPAVCESKSLWPFPLAADNNQYRVSQLGESLKEWAPPGLSGMA